MSTKVLITAEASGVGCTVAETFDAAGVQVCVADMDAVALSDCLAHWKQSEVDVAEKSAVAAMIAELEAEWNGLDVLCANANIAGPTVSVEDVKITDWRDCISVNLEGSIL